MGHLLDQMSDEDLFIGGFALAITLGALGLIGHAVLRESGFGVIVNGILIVGGIVAGIAARGMVMGLQ